jgi:hypothetical protein
MSSTCRVPQGLGLDDVVVFLFGARSYNLPRDPTRGHPSYQVARVIPIQPLIARVDALSLSEGGATMN